MTRRKLQRVRSMLRLYDNWPTAILARAGVIQRPCVFRLSSIGWDSPLYLVSGRSDLDIRVINEMWLERPYLRHWKGAPDTVVDIGANRGYFSVFAKHQMGARRVIAFEPEPLNLALLTANSALNRAEVEVSPVALVSDERTHVTLHTSKHPALHTIVAKEDAALANIQSDGRYASNIIVPAERFDSALSRIGRIDFCKIDTEGTELDLLRSASDEVLRSIKYLAAETESQAADDISERLLTLGFRVVIEDPYLFALGPADADGAE